MKKWHLDNNSGTVKGNNPYILNRMTIDSSFRNMPQQTGFIGYDTQGNGVSSGGNTMMGY